MLDEFDEILSVEALTIILGMSKNTILKLLNEGVIPGRKVGKKWRVLKEELIESLKNLNQK